MENSANHFDSRWFHGTDGVFDAFSLDFAARLGMNGNGHLGIWLARESWLAREFGRYCLEVEATGTARRMPIGELAQLNRDCQKLVFTAATPTTEQDVRQMERQFYEIRRESLLKEGIELLLIEELDGRVDVAVALAPGKLRIVSRQESLG